MMLLLQSYGLGIYRVSQIELPHSEPIEITSDVLIDRAIGSNKYFEYVKDVKTNSVIYMVEEGMEPSILELRQLEIDKDIVCRAVLVNGSRRFKNRFRTLLTRFDSIQ